MTCVAFLLIAVFATSKASLLHCSSTDDSGSSSMDDFQQVTMLQYCVLDNCTIIRIDTGEKLDIVYTTESIIVINPTDGHTSSVIAKDDNELPCFIPNAMVNKNYHIAELIGTMTIAVLTMTASGYVLIVHLLFKELHNLMGKLMIFYNFAMVFRCIIVGVWLLLHYKIPVNSQITCHTITILFMATSLGGNAVITCIFAYITNNMYHSHKLKSIMSKSRSKFLYNCYTTYVIGTITFYLFIIIAYDLRTGNGRYTLEPNGHCKFLHETTYNTFDIISINSAINKVPQIIMFITCLYYFYKINIQIQKPQYSKHLLILAITMGANLGISDFIWICSWMVGLRDTPIASISGAIFLLIQQCVIMITFMCTPKISRLCKELFYSNIVQ